MQQRAHGPPQPAQTERSTAVTAEPSARAGGPPTRQAAAPLRRPSPRRRRAGGRTLPSAQARSLLGRPRPKDEVFEAKPRRIQQRGSLRSKDSATPVRSARRRELLPSATSSDTGARRHPSVRNRAAPAGADRCWRPPRPARGGARLDWGYVRNRLCLGGSRQRVSGQAPSPSYLSPPSQSGRHPGVGVVAEPKWTLTPMVRARGGENDAPHELDRFSPRPRG
jgi:hypothetical protein